MLFSSARYPKTILLRSSTVFKSDNTKRIKIFKMILRKKMKYDKNEHMKSHRQHSVGADPKVYSYDLQLNLDKNGSSVGEAFICL